MSEPLTPSDDTDLLEPSRRQLPLTTGLADTADIPAKNGRSKADVPACHAPCPRCGVMVLTGTTTAGVQVQLDIQGQSYTVLWLPESAQPVLYQSRGYPTHRCVPAPREERE